jgi:4-alpha-glucanotransferase
LSERDSCWLDERSTALLLHISSLPGPGPCGDLGAAAHRFAEFAAACGFGVWQVLPVGPTGPDGSPYQSASSHAGNSRFISLERVVEAGWLAPSELPRDGADGADRAEALALAAKRFHRKADTAQRKAKQAFCGEHKAWLDDFALFCALQEETHLPWWEWPAALRDREPQAMAEARARLAPRMRQVRFEQFLFFSQWADLRRHAAAKGVRLFGDLPIFVALDSAEVWAHREFFHLDQDGRPTVVAGVPPDYFSATGQRWGNPLYRWDVMHADGFSFWVERMRTQLRLFDLIRIDHFRGFEAYWEIPATEPDAVQGRWVPGPGDLVFDRLRDALGDLPLVAEDLGVITDEVRALRDRQGMPGMRILQFAFSGGPDNPYLPFRHTENSVVYTGTHDNDTTLGWYLALNDGERHTVDEYLGHSRDPMPWPLIHAALMSPARLAAVPMQDLLGLDGTHRMNLPGTSEGNWQWRFDWDSIPADLPEQFRHMVWMAGRLAP